MKAFLMNKALAFALCVGLLVAVMLPASAQQNVPGNAINSPYAAALITDTAAAAGTVLSATQQSLTNRGVICTMNMSAHTGTPSTTFSIQIYDPISNTWQSVVTSGAITVDATPTSIIVYPGIQTAALPTGMVGSGLHITRRWRLSRTVGGTSPVVTATYGCELLS